MRLDTLAPEIMNRASLSTFLVLAIFAAPVAAQDTHMQKALRVLSTTPLIDGHNDLPWAIRNSELAPHDVAADGHNLRETTPFHTDIDRLRAGRVGGQFWSVYIPFEASEEGAAKATGTYEHVLLADALRKKQMLPYRARIRARRMEEFDGWVRHDGEEFLYVLTGMVRLFTEFYEPVDMRRGDSAYYDATMGHNVVSLSDEDATILWVTSLV